ncbi:Cullin-associated NEDD8-dissociated protein 1 [Candida viswanathii]|uniref:Cullin-associated NEDD8-dissociated protein 1 n=1 Tax=Candida viswanathii TaxID=5486 RepID=A0A367YG94_9ASCO|nr:Cullin-associated NEDD8-dissociated protein 1 [Candida viswanathii]
MVDINFNVLKDRAMDVDPDIRFMALEDLRKFLQDEPVASTRTNLNHSLENFFPILLNMLNDQNPDVQSQAVKSFEPMVRYLSNETLLKLVKKLFTLVQQGGGSSGSSTVANLKNFTISIPNMALRSLFAQSNSRDKSEFVSDKLSSSNYRFDPRLARAIMDYLIPQIVGHDVSIDSIELLIDLIAEIGYVLHQDELLSLSLFLINVALAESGLIGKKSMVALEKVVALIRTESIIDQLLMQIKQVEAESKLYIIFPLYSICLKRGLQPSRVDFIYDTIVSILRADLSEEVDDLDFDVLVKENALKDEAFVTLIDLVSQNFLPVAKKDEVIELIKIYLKYNPLGQDDDFDDDEDEEIVFSDDEQEGEEDSENDGSWKLRARAAILVRAVLDVFPASLDTLSHDVLDLLPFADSNDQVVAEAIKTAIVIVNATSPRDAQTIRELGPVITSRLSSAKETQLPLFLKLIESLNRFDNAVLVQEAFKIFQSRGLVTSGSFEYLQFYSSALKFHDELPANVIEWMVKDFIVNLEDKSFNMIIDTIKCLNLLFRQVNIGNVNEIVDKLINKVENSKKYPSDLIRQSILALGQAFPRSDKEKILNALKSSIGLEGTKKATIDVLSEVYSDEIPAEYSLFVLGKLSSSIMSSNEGTSVASLLLMRKIIGVVDGEDYSEIIRNLTQLLAVTNKTNYESIFDIFNKLANIVFQNNEYKLQLLSTIVKLANDNKIDVHEDSFFEFLKNGCGLDSTLYDHFESSLKLDSQVSAKILAICAIKNNLEDKIAKRRQEFQLYFSNDINNKQFAFDILFLGYVGSQVEIQELDIQTLIGLLQAEKFSSDANIQAASTALGLIAKKNVESAVPIILDTYTKSDKTIIRGSLLDALCIAVDSCNEEQKKFIWDKVFNYPIEFDHEVISELRKAGELLGKIVVVDDLTTTTDNLTSIYLILVVTKSLLSNLQATLVNNSLLDSLSKSSIEWLSIPNIDIRQIIVGNLLTGLHTKPAMLLPILQSVILPNVFVQLKAEEQFKKIIAMGPYKYVLDEGLEIRKLCYEFIYSVIALDEATLAKNKVNLEDIAAKIIEFGLTDDQTDITLLACINLINYIDLHKNSAVELVSRDRGALLTNMIASLKKQLSKKLSAKASAQDTETHQERIKSIIKLSKKFNSVVEAAENSELATAIKAWNDYTNDLKANYTIYYNSTDDL